MYNTYPKNTSRNRKAYRRNRMGRRILSIVLLVLIVVLVLLLTGVLKPNEWFGGSGPEASPSGEAISSQDITQSPPTTMDPATPGPKGSEPTATATPEPTPEPTPGPTQEPVVRAPGHENMPEYGSVAASGDLAALEKTLRDKIAGFAGTYGVTFVNLATGERFGINDTQRYIAASTSKFPMNVLLWKRIASGEIDPDMMLEYKPEDLEYGTGIIQNQPYGTTYTVRKTSELSVIHSDNCGINMIIRLLNIEDIRQYLRDLGGVVEYDNRHRSCPADMANVAVDLYRFYWENPAVAGELIQYLENTDWSDRIDAKLPDGVKVAHKIGNQTRTSNDVGIVFASQPFVLSFMTADTDHGTACTNIATLSRIVYDHVEAQP